MHAWLCTFFGKFLCSTLVQILRPPQLLNFSTDWVKPFCTFWKLIISLQYSSTSFHTLAKLEFFGTKKGFRFKYEFWRHLKHSQIYPMIIWYLGRWEGPFHDFCLAFLRQTKIRDVESFFHESRQTFMTV